MFTLDLAGRGKSGLETRSIISVAILRGIGEQLEEKGCLSGNVWECPGHGFKLHAKRVLVFINCQKWTRVTFDT